MSFIRAVAVILLGALIAGAVFVFVIEPRHGATVRRLVPDGFLSPADAPVIPREHDDGIIDVSATEQDGVEHEIGPTVSIRSPDPKKNTFPQNTIKLELIVDRTGNVIAATATDGAREFFAEAERLARTVKFMPFQRDGKPVVARIKEFYIAVFPPERRPSARVPFPTIRDWTSLRMSFQTSGCYGSCPSYRVEVQGDGTVFYEGIGFVALTGRHRATIPQERVRKLFEEFRRADFFWLFGEYRDQITDMSTQRVRLSFDGRAHQVIDYAGQMAGMPDVVRDIENAIDRAAGTDRWVKGNEETVPSLQAEGWDFKSASEHNTTMVRGVAAYGNARALRDLIAQGAPVTSRKTVQDFETGGETALEFASSRNNKEMVVALLQPGIGWDRRALGRSLIRACFNGGTEIMTLLLGARAGRAYEPNGDTNALMAAAGGAFVDIVNELLSPRWPPPIANVHAVDGRGWTAMFYVASGGDRRVDEVKVDRLAVVEILIKAGARIDHRDKEGNTPLIANENANVAVALIKAGADVNAQNKDGETALMTTYDPDVLLVLLKAGADPRIRNAKGEDALAVARKKWHAKKTVPVLEKWLAEHPSTPR